MVWRATARFFVGLAPYLALTLFCAALFLPGLSTIPPLDRDEARFAQATRQMLESGDFVDIRFQETARHKKPAGIHWLQAAAVGAAGSGAETAIWPYRLPSVAGAWAAVLLTFVVGARLFDRRTGFLGALLLAGSLLLILEAHQAKTDAVLVAAVVAAQAVLARFYMTLRDPSAPRPSGIGVALAFWVAIGVAILIKGPIGPFFVFLTVLSLAAAERRWRWLLELRPLPGVVAAAAIVLPWGLAILLATGGSFYTTAVGGDLIAKLASGQESHGAPPGYFALLMLATFWPASLFAWPAVIAARRHWATPGVRFCLAWLVPAWVMLELVPTKLPHYVLPLYPPLALLTASLLLAGRASAADLLAARWVKALHVIWAAAAILLAGAALVLPVVAGEGPTPWALVPAAAAVAAAILPLHLAWHGRPLAAATTALVLGSLAVTASLHWVLPRLSDAWVSVRVAAAVQTAEFSREAPIAMAGFSEPSVVFLLGTDTRLTNGAGAAVHLAAHPRTLAFVSEREESAFRAAAAEQGFSVEGFVTVVGFNYSKGNRVTLTGYRRLPGG
jgi:4-amino-4-deoxy-L-arabinose transferase-like glycosyltransferase